MAPVPPSVPTPSPNLGQATTLSLLVGICKMGIIIATISLANRGIKLIYAKWLVIGQPSISGSYDYCHRA